MNTWLITGCSCGLGRGIARAALEQGEQVAVTARHPEAVQELVQAYPGRALALRLVLEDPASMAQAVEAACQHFGKIDILVNNAGYGYRAAIEESEPEQTARLFRTNFFAPLELATEALAKEVSHLGIRTMLVEPDSFLTRFYD